MIRVLPDNEAGRVLRTLARLPEGATIEQLAGHLYRQPPHPALVGTYAQKVAARRTWQDACRTAEDAARTKISGLVRELARLSLVERIGPPRVASWVDQAEVLARPPSQQRLLARLVTESPPSRAKLRLSSAGERTYDRLVADGLIVPPSVRTLSPSGAALVTSWSTPHSGVAS